MPHISYDDAHAMFADCILEHNGRLIHSRVVEPHADHGSILLCRDIESGRNLRVENPNPEELHCPSEPYRLGYVQHGPRVYYMSRNPRRQYRIGWSEANVSNLSISAFTASGVSFLNNLKGIFMDYKTALDRSREAPGNFAFDRQFAVRDRGTVLEYKGRSIVHIDQTTGMPDLSRGYEHLESLLQMAMNKGN